MRRLSFAACWLIAVVLAASFLGCGGGSPSPSSGPSPHRGTIPTSSIAIPPESARTPDGAVPARPPITLQPAPSAKHIDATGLHLIEGFEGYSRCAYWDPYGGVWTAGYGQTRGIYGGFCFAGQAAAEANLKASVESEYEWALRGLGVPFSQHQWDALCSFVYNLGAGIFTGSLRSAIQGHNPYPMLAYDHAGGVVLPGLYRRRHEEVALFLQPEANRPAPKPTHKALVHRRELLRRDLTRRRCRVIHSRRAYPLCPRWAREGRQVNRELKGTR